MPEDIVNSLVLNRIRDEDVNVDEALTWIRHRRKITGEIVNITGATGYDGFIINMVGESLSPDEGIE